jgi:hypothetical protein
LLRSGATRNKGRPVGCVEGRMKALPIADCVFL